MMFPRSFRVLASLLVLSCIWSFGCRGAEPADSLAATGTVAVDVARSEVRQALDRFFQAAREYDWATLDDLLASDFEFYSDDLLRLGRDEFLAVMQDDSMEITDFALADVTVNVSADAHMAWVKYEASMESSIRGQPFNMMSAETVIMRKEGGHWKMTHNHASVRELSD